MVDFFADANRSGGVKSTKTVETGSASDCEIKSPLDGHIYPTPPHTPSSLNDNELLKYISEASEHAVLAVDFEKSGNYEDAFTSYKTSIDILLKGVKGICFKSVFVITNKVNLRSVHTRFLQNKMWSCCLSSLRCNKV